MSRFRIRDIVTLGDRHDTGKRIQDGQYLATEAILRRLYGLDQRGVVLADEVGLGKTFVALGVAAWLLKNHPRSRVLVLTNSRLMVGAWADRWNAIQAHGWAKPGMRQISGYEEYAKTVSDAGCRLVVTSYETLKRESGVNWDQYLLDIGNWLFRPRFHPGIKLSDKTLRQVKKSLEIRANGPTDKLKRRIPDSLGRQWWRKHFDRDTRRLKDPEKARDDMTHMELQFQASGGRPGRRYRFDLAIIDEAHRFDSEGRRHLIEQLLARSVEKFLHVTATPFALNVSQLERLLNTFQEGLKPAKRESHANSIRSLRLEEFERSVGMGEPMSDLRVIERGLRRWLVRRTWKEEARGRDSVVKERRQNIWRIDPESDQGFIATLALERAIAELHRSGSRTHISSRRTSLCSSWSSALASLESVQFGARTSPEERYRRVAAMVLRPVAREDSTKVAEAAAKIVHLVRSGRKVLLFAERQETLKSLERKIRKQLSEEVKQARSQRDRLLQWYRAGRLAAPRHVAGEGLPADSFRALLAAIAGDRTAKTFDKGSANRCVRRWLATSGRIEERLGWLGNSFEGQRQIRAVEIYDGTHGDEATANRFNLPGTPWVLLCSRKAQESIDLHVECSTVVLFDPVWNPAHREQRIGRVQRIGSRFRKIDVIDVLTTGTYEEYTYNRSMARARMMRILLGAGRWLDEDREIEDPEKWSIDLSPRSNLEKGLLTEARG